MTLFLTCQLTWIIRTLFTSVKTPLANVKDEDISCEYLEVNEIVEPVNNINWCPPSKRKIITSEYHCMELKDQISRS